MWIVDVQLPLDGNESTPKGLKSIVLNKGKVYKVGRSIDCDISLNLKKVSRFQTNIEVLNDGSLKLLNIGHATWIYNHNKELKGSCNDSLILTTNTLLKLRSSNWQFEFFRVNDFQISESLKDAVHLDFLNISNDLEYNEIKKNGLVEKIENVNEWIEKIKLKRWEKIGGLAKYIIPKTEKDVIEIRDDDDEDDDGDERVVNDDKINLLKEQLEAKSEENLIDIEPFHSQLTQREAKRNRKSQLERMFDEMDDLDDLDTYASQSVPKEKSQITNNQSSPINSLDMSRLSLKRNTGVEHKAPAKKQKIMENIDEEMEPNVLVNNSTNNLLLIKDKNSIKSPTSTLNNDKLTEIFKKTKQMKINKDIEDEKLIKSSLNKVKIKKIHVNLQSNDKNNPKIYSNYNLSYGNNPQWENRLNYSKFIKSTNGNYNPIMDSTIKTVKFKNSNYKSNEVQVNLEQNNDIIQELDAMFSNNIPKTRKRRRENRLFVDSDDNEDDNEEDDYNFSNISNINNRESLNIQNNISPAYHDLSTSSLLISRNKPTNNITNYNSYNNDEDDTPVFKSRRR